MCEHVAILCATTNGWRVEGGVQPFLGMWPSLCQSWVAIQKMYSLESHGTENRGSFLQQYYPFLVDVAMAKHNTLPGDGSRSGDINTTMTWLLLFFYFFHVPRGHQHHDDVVVIVLPLFCI